MRVLRHPVFLVGDADTQFLERHPVADLAAPLADAPAEGLSAAAAALAAQAARRAAARCWPRSLPAGDNPSQPQRVVFDGEHGRWFACGSDVAGSTWSWTASAWPGCGSGPAGPTWSTWRPAGCAAA